MSFFRKRKKILALGGGSARGFCNIGVLRTLEKYFGAGKLPFDMIVGSSIGSLIGAAYCAGKTLDEIEEVALTVRWPNIVDFGIFSTGLVKGDKMQGIIESVMAGLDFSNMKIPFAVTTTNLQTGEELVHTSGDLVKILRASCSWPGIFTAVDYDGMLLVDGGVRNSIPTKAAYDMGATFVLAVDPGFAIMTEKINNVLLAIVQSVQIMGEELNHYQSKAADIAIKPIMEDANQFDFDKASIIIKHGEIAAEKMMPKILRKLGGKV